MSNPGRFFLVVGPSGVGKDTLLDGARVAMAGEAVFAQRVITRPADAGGEAHEAATPEAFEAQARSGGFLVTWQAHGLQYGLPAKLFDELMQGRDVIANGSRGVIAKLATRVPRLIVISITADRALLADRIAARGRESGVELARRLDRAAPEICDGVQTRHIANNGTIAEGIARFVAALRA